MASRRIGIRGHCLTPKQVRFEVARRFGFPFWFAMGKELLRASLFGIRLPNDPRVISHVRRGSEDGLQKSILVRVGLRPIVRSRFRISSASQPLSRLSHISPSKLLVPKPMQKAM